MKRIIILILAVTSFSCIQSLDASTVTGNLTAPKKVDKDTLKTVLSKAAAGDAVAQNLLGVWYYNGLYVKKDYREAFNWWARSAKQDNAEAIGNMAVCYQYGNGVKADSTMAVKLYKQSLRKGNETLIKQHENAVAKTKSMFSIRLLYDCYRNGIGVKKDNTQAEKYQAMIAQSGDVSEQFSLGLKCLNGKRTAEAAKWFKMAAGKGHLQSTYYYGYLLFNGMGVKQDKTSGIALIQKTADRGLAAAHWQLGRIYYDGDGTDKDYNTAVSHLKTVAATNKDAAWLLGQCYLNGYGVRKDYSQAIQWISQAARTHEKQLNTLFSDIKDGGFYSYVSGLKAYYVAKDYEKAVSMFKKVEKMKNAEGSTMLGVCLADKKYGKYNAKKAVKSLEKAVADSSLAACLYLSEMCASGDGMKNADKQRAFELLVKAADGGVAAAQCRLGDYYFTGENVTKDFTKAAQYYMAAESQNLLTPASAANLIKCYERGITALPDVNNAKQRIEALKKVKENTSLIDLLKAIKE